MATTATKTRIAVLTSGGDSAGMNAVVRGVVKFGILKYVVTKHNNLVATDVLMFSEAARHMWSGRDTKDLSGEMWTL